MAILGRGQRATSIGQTMMPDVPETEFFSAAAAIAGTLWVITTGLFAFVGVVRSRLLSVGITLLLLVGSVGIITISSLFLGSMVVALAMLLPPGPRASALGPLPAVVLLGLATSMLLIAWQGSRRQGLRERLGKPQIILIVIYAVCGLLLLGMVTGANCLAHGQSLFCRAVGLSSIRADLFVINAILLGCLLSLLFGVLSMQLDLIVSSQAPKPDSNEGET